MRRSPRTSLMALLVAVLAIAAAGCGGSEVAADEVPGAPPALTVPTDSDLGGSNAADDAAADADGNAADGAAATGTAEPDAAAPSTDDTSGGAVAPEATAAPDAAATDTPPDAGTQFEDFCEQNAGAC